MGLIIVISTICNGLLLDAITEICCVVCGFSLDVVKDVDVYVEALSQPLRHL